MKLGRWFMPVRKGGTFAATFAAMLIAGGLGACAMPGGTPPEPASPVTPWAGGVASLSSDSPSARVVAELVDALVQLRPPASTTLQIGPDAVDADEGARALRRVLVDALATAGYGIQRVSADQGANHLDWRWTPVAGADASVMRARLAVGAVSLERDYRLRDDAASPVGRLAIAGTRSPVTLDEARFGETAADARGVRYAASGPRAEDAPIISLVTRDVVAGVARRASGRGPSQQGLNSSRMEVENLFYGQGAFGDLRSRMQVLEREVVIFPNDSMRLGDVGKLSIEQFVQAFRPNTDMIGLVGCSNGPTALEIGNEGLALGRSARVSDELIALGIDRTSILDEGCWAPTSAGDRFPSRGVVIELLRRPVG